MTTRGTLVEQASRAKVGSIARGLLLLALAMLGVDRCHGEENILGPLNATITLPPVGYPVLGFRTQILVSDVNSTGSTPVKIIFQSVGASTVDRNLTYRFRTQPGGESPPRNGLSIDVPIAVPQGTKTESFVRYLPKWSSGQAIVVQVLEDGRVLEDYTAFVGQPIFGARSMLRGRRATYNFLESERQIDWVYISDEDVASPQSIPDLRSLFLHGDLKSTRQLRLDPITESELVQWKQSLTASPLVAVGQGSLPTDWRSYQHFDAIIISSRGLARLQDRENALNAVRSWVLNGGTVLVYDAESIDSVAESLRFRPTNNSEEKARIQSIGGELNYYIRHDEKTIREHIGKLQQYIDAYAGTENPDPNSTNVAAVYINSSLLPIHNSFSGDVGLAEKEMLGEVERLKVFSEISRYRDEQWMQQVWIQPAGAGNVIGIKGSDQYDVPPLLHWKVARRVIGYRASPMLRRGVDPMIGDRRFSRWLIPGVAQPPVYTFMGLLTVFVVLVGPVAYRRTAKVGRSYLMFAIAPLLALVTTVAMFGYGIVSDGFSTVVRARQLTWVDGKSGDAGERVRATYFAGVRPGDGLRFAPDAEVLGYPEGLGMSWREANLLSPSTIGSVSIRDDAQVFDSSFLPSRQQRQFVIHAPRRGAGYLQLTSDSSTRVQNGFDFPIREAVIRDRQGNYWHVADLSAGQSVACQPLSLKDSSKTLGRIYNDHRPLSATREARESQANYSNDVYDVIVDTNRKLGIELLVYEGVFEQWLQEHLQTAGEIPVDHFVATADVSADVLATESELVSSVRYVFGTLR